jgi:hypothetical protein
MLPTLTVVAFWLGKLPSSQVRSPPPTGEHAALDTVRILGAGQVCLSLKMDAQRELNNIPFGEIGHRQERSVAICQRGRQSRRQRVSSGCVGMHGSVVIDL